MAKLTEKQQRFVEEYLVDLNATQAAIRAGYSVKTADVQGSRMLRNVNQYAKMVNQKSNYLLGNPFTIETDNEQYSELLKEVFNKKFMRTLKKSGKYALNGGMAWLYPYYDEEGKFTFRLFPSYEILPFWADSEHTKLQGAVRLYLVAGYEKNIPVVIEKVEIFDMTGIHRYILDGATLAPDKHLTDDEDVQNNEDGDSKK